MLQSTFSTVCADPVTDALAVNTSGAPPHLKSDTCLADFQVYNKSVQSEPLDFPVACDKSTSGSSWTDCENLRNTVACLSSLIKVVGYPERKSQLLDILATYRDVIALPGEPLGVTDHAIHHTALKPGSHPVYVPSYRLPHSQCKIVDGMVQEMLNQGVTEESSSPWNSPLFLVYQRWIEAGDL